MTCEPASSVTATTRTSETEAVSPAGESGEISTISVTQSSLTRPAGDAPSDNEPADLAAQQPVSAPLVVSPPVSQPADDDKPVLWLRRGDQIFVGTLLAVCLVLLVLHALRLGTGRAQLIEIERLPETKYQYRLDINSATWVEWAQLDGIGETLARRIIADRETHGPFPTVNDLNRVRGIGPKTLERIRPWLEVRRSSPNP